MENLYGDIISTSAPGLVGGLGGPGANIGERTAVFEAVHGTAPDIAGKGLANPTALMMSVGADARLARAREASRRLDRALNRVYSEGRVRTHDLGGSATTRSSPTR
jgi:isocitrate dehydrogenase (NAD+)